jgi:hypothetical protein
MKYRYGFPYQVAEDEIFQTQIHPCEDIHTQFVDLFTSGELVVKSGYAWDGPSGPTKAIVGALEKIPFIGAWLVKKFLNAFLTPSLGHDVKYQLIRQGLIEKECKIIADDELRDDCLARDMSKLRAAWVHKGVKDFASFAIDPKNVKKIYEVP